MNGEISPNRPIGGAPDHSLTPKEDDIAKGTTAKKLDLTYITLPKEIQPPKTPLKTIDDLKEHLEQASGTADDLKGKADQVIGYNLNTISQDLNKMGSTQKNPSLTKIKETLNELNKDSKKLTIKKQEVLKTVLKDLKNDSSIQIEKRTLTLIDKTLETLPPDISKEIVEATSTPAKISEVKSENPIPLSKRVDSLARPTLTRRLSGIFRRGSIDSSKALADKREEQLATLVLLLTNVQSSKGDDYIKLLNKSSGLFTKEEMSEMKTQKKSATEIITKRIADFSKSIEALRKGSNI